MNSMKKFLQLETNSLQKLIPYYKGISTPNLKKPFLGTKKRTLIFTFKSPITSLQI